MEFFKNFDRNSHFLRVGKVDTKSDDSGILMKFLKIWSEYYTMAEMTFIKGRHNFEIK